MTIAEPMTAVTDWIIAAIALVCALRLRVDPRQRSIARWRMAFLATAAGSIAGGLAHALSQTLSILQLLILWKTTTLSLGLASFFMLIATAASRLLHHHARLLTGVAVGQIAVYSLWMLGHNDFIWVILNYGASMVAVAAIHLLTYREAPQSARWILTGIGISAVGAAVQALEVSPHPNFNHNDLFHVIQMASLVVLFRGARLSKDRR